MQQPVKRINAVPTIPTANTVRVEMVFVMYSQRMENVFHVRTPGVPTPADLAAIVNVFKQWYTPAVAGPLNYRAVQSSACTIALIRATSIHGVNDAFHEFTYNPALAGAVASNAPPHHTLCVKWNTGFSGRNFRGRTYMCGMPYMPQNDGLLLAGTQGTIQQTFDLLRSSLNTAGYPLVVASFYDGVQIVNGYRRGIPRAAGVTTLITSCSVERTFDTQRKRKIPHNV